MKHFSLSKRFINRFLFICAILVTFVAAVLWKHPEMTERSGAVPVEPEPVGIEVKEPIQPVPLHIQLDAGKVALGEKLFYDTQLSHNNTIACATCHNFKTGGTNRIDRSTGMNGALSSVNTPTIFNSGLNFKQNWDGSAETLEAQIDKAIYNPNDMNSNWPEIVSKLKASPEYVKLFDPLYAGDMRAESIQNAIATFERSLYTPNSRFDKFLRGNLASLSYEEQEGYRIFKAYGCASCHQGVNVGGNLFQKFGIMGDYFAERGKVTKADLGRFNVTSNPQDKYVFKVPSLRNITLTSPYFHDGSAKTLSEAIAVMAKYQLGRQLSPEEIDLIVKFLTALTGEYQGKSL
ncbi:cytochrome-c peroxidase [Kamptonema formosum]|uniref:cytochrome-c peroxidase n=1 Tax=Kamptonema formosum TaxID=331992 RepID=UPI00034A84FD|nr:cytochrome c peroxidase [Oscillatoria sp. PCC 10802]